jgi:hypothetical protein
LTILALIGGALLFLLAGVVRSVVSDEAKGWGRDLGLSLVKRAVQQLPPDFQADKQLEWEGEFLDLASAKPISALMWSWRLFRFRHSTAHEMRVDASSTSPFADSEPITLRPPEEMPPYLRSLVDGLHAYGWQRIAAAMQDATLAHVDERINVATARFFAVIDGARAVSSAPLPRFGPPPGSYAWSDVYDPAPPELSPNFKVYSSLRQEVIPPPERWPIRWLRSFLALDCGWWWIVGIPFIPLLSLLLGMPLWAVAITYGVWLNFETASRPRRIAMLSSFGLFLGYALWLLPFVVEHGLVEFEVARVFGLALLGVTTLCLFAPIELIGKLYRRFSRRRRSRGR